MRVCVVEFRLRMKTEETCNQWRRTKKKFTMKWPWHVQLDWYNEYSREPRYNEGLSDWQNIFAIPSISLYGEVRYVKVPLKLPLKWFQHNCLDPLTTTKCHKLRASSLGRHGGEAIKEGELASRLTRHGTRYVLDTTFFPLKGKWQMTILPHPKEAFAFFCPLLQTRRIYALLLPYLKKFGH